MFMRDHKGSDFRDYCNFVKFNAENRNLTLESSYSKKTIFKMADLLYYQGTLTYNGTFSAGQYNGTGQWFSNGHSYQVKPNQTFLVSCNYDDN